LTKLFTLRRKFMFSKRSCSHCMQIPLLSDLRQTVRGSRWHSLSLTSRLLNIVHCARHPQHRASLAVALGAPEKHRSRALFHKLGKTYLRICDLSFGASESVSRVNCR
jgi:hypothetical protein